MEIEIDRRVGKKLEKLPATPKKAIKKLLHRIFELETTAEIRGEKLLGYKNLYKLRVGNYRIVYQKIESTLIRVTVIAHRKEIYRQF